MQVVRARQIDETRKFNKSDAALYRKISKLSTRLSMPRLGRLTTRQPGSTTMTSALHLARAPTNTGCGCPMQLCRQDTPRGHPSRRLAQLSPTLQPGQLDVLLPMLLPVPPWSATNVGNQDTTPVSVLRTMPSRLDVGSREKLA